MFRTLKALRTVKIVNFLIIGADTLIQIKIMIQRIILCLPLIFKLIPLILMVFYIYSIFGMEYFNHETSKTVDNSPFNIYTYADFSTFSGALLILF